MLRLSLVILVVLHLLLVLINLIAMPCLLLYQPWYVSVPLVSFLIRLATVERECPLTIVENWLRNKLGMKVINTFIGHYIMKYIYKIFKISKGV